MEKLQELIKKEPVLCAAGLLAVISMFVVHPDAAYVSYVDFRTLSILFCLMSVMAGLRKAGVFKAAAGALLEQTTRMTGVMFILVLFCFFGSMFITNDVALITFVPLTLTTLQMMGEGALMQWMVPIVAMQTVAANLGSMLTPIGNPQNLYLYGKADMMIGSFVLLMLPYSVFALVLLVVWILAEGRKAGEDVAAQKAETTKEGTLDETVAADPEDMKNKVPVGTSVFYLILFVISLCTVARVLPFYVSLVIVLAAILIKDRSVLRNVDYSLLLTFVGFFIFIGNMGRVEPFRLFVDAVLDGHEVVTAIVSSQVISNVPAALLLSGFTDQYESLIIGTNLGGLGTLIASMASLISYKAVAAECRKSQAMQPLQGKYFRVYTVSNVIFLLLLVGLWMIIG